MVRPSHAELLLEYLNQLSNPGAERHLPKWADWVALQLSGPVAIGAAIALSGCSSDSVAPSPTMDAGSPGIGGERTAFGGSSTFGGSSAMGSLYGIVYGGTTSGTVSMGGASSGGTGNSPPTTDRINGLGGSASGGQGPLGTAGTTVPASSARGGGVANGGTTADAGHSSRAGSANSEAGTAGQAGAAPSSGTSATGGSAGTSSKTSAPSLGGAGTKYGGVLRGGSNGTGTSTTTPSAGSSALGGVSSVIEYGIFMAGRASAR